MDVSDNDRSLYEPVGSASILTCSGMTENSSKMTGPAPAKRRVLVVEDEMLIGMLLEDMLTDLGHEVAAIVPRLKDALAAVDKRNLRSRDPRRASAWRKRISGRRSADRQGHPVRVRHRLRRTRPAGELSRPPGAAEAVRQGRSRAHLADTRTEVRALSADCSRSPGLRRLALRRQRLLQAAHRLPRIAAQPGEPLRQVHDREARSTSSALPSSSQVSGVDTVAPGRARVE